MHCSRATQVTTGDAAGRTGSRPDTGGVRPATLNNGSTAATFSSPNGTIVTTTMVNLSSRPPADIFVNRQTPPPRPAGNAVPLFVKSISQTHLWEGAPSLTHRARRVPQPSTLPGAPAAKVVAVKMSNRRKTP